ncbi:hypothetical protein JOF29_007221 [Kribbella aluminosa]|uniref:alpha-L-fucosidase n=1 Tax=Kribbella aluminosa TaxID=416017 RepID=A0ABS4UX42_9ACTN|nr:alpha-L-fucosidase [Kribbella aluminosa]MBP2356111.1 hypothetical protein [Kribbella aluminosa]
MHNPSPGRNELTWEQVQERFACPPWLAEARFGIWVHWGFKDVIHEWKAAELDGEGTWWDGLDPADLYGPPPSRLTDEWIAGMEQQWELRRTLIEMLFDIISKNGNLLFNVELTPDGKVPDDHRPILDGLGAWIRTHAEAIFASNPWHVYGDNQAANTAVRTVDNADLAGAKEHTDGHFNERTLAGAPYPHDEVRFTTRNNHLYVFVLNPEAGELVLPALGPDSPLGPEGPAAVRLIGSEAVIDHHVHDNGLSLRVPPSGGVLTPQSSI